MENGWTIHDAARHLHLSEIRVRQKIREGSLTGWKVKGHYGLEWRVSPVLPVAVDSERLARLVLEQGSRLYFLEALDALKRRA